MMNRHEKWEHERNLDEIVDRLSQLLVSIMLMSVKQVSEQYLSLKKRLKANQPDDIPF
jgi:hypothetical protein